MISHPDPPSAAQDSRPFDIVILGAGAAGFMAAITAARATGDAQNSLRILLLDSSPKPGTKILIAGGGRCNVTHHRVDPNDYNGATAPAIRKILGRFGVEETVAFFKAEGVELKRETTGKLFPVSDKAKTVLAALETACARAGVQRRHPWKAVALEAVPPGFRLRSEAGAVVGARRVILATGGKSLPKTGSDGSGYALAQGFEHTLTPHILPALVPLVVEDGHFIRSLSGLTLPTALEIRSASGKRLARAEGSTLLTHFGLSGPPVLDISRHWLMIRNADPGATFHVNWKPDNPAADWDRELIALGKGSLLGLLRARLPERLAEALCRAGGLDPSLTGDKLSRTARKALVKAITDTDLPVTGTKGFALAEVTAGGLPLPEFRLESLESRRQPGLYACGEILDVDGRIGGFNFQWAWASGFVAGSAAARGLLEPDPPQDG